MAGYGANNFRWAKLTSDADPSKLPTYEAAMSMGPLTSVTDAVTMVSGENYGDDQLQDFVEEFQKLEIDVGSTDIPVATAAAFLGATLAEDGELHLNTEDAAPYGGAAFVARRGRKEADGTYKRYFRAVMYPMIKGRKNNGAVTTKGSSITFANDSAHFTGKAAANGDYMIQKDFETMDAAMAWLDTVMPLAK